jgi:hypothetical protein
MVSKTAIHNSGLGVALIELGFRLPVVQNIAVTTTKSSVQHCHNFLVQPKENVRFKEQ